MKRLLIAGCGDLGIRLSERLRPEGWSVTGLRRNPDRLPSTVRPLAADLSAPDSLIQASGVWDAVVYTATPGERTPAAYRQTYVDGLARLLDNIRCDRLIFVSSTAVYGQDNGEWVDENTDTRPADFAGQILLEAEALAREAGGIIVRFGGIYGPGRGFLLRLVRAGPVACRKSPPLWTNRIHVEDCVSTLACLLDSPALEAVFCATDGSPAPRWEVLSWLAQRIGAEGPREDPDARAGEGRRVCNRRLLEAGVQLRYPDFRSGYEALLSNGAIV